MSKIETVDVLMRLSADGSGEAIAFFPFETGTSDPYTMGCYAHIGQHGSAAIEYYRETKPGNIHSDANCRDLWRELRDIYEGGTDPVELRLIYRMPRNAIQVRRGKLAC